MIWAFLFSLLFAGGGAQLGDYTAIGNFDKKSSNKILEAVLEEEDLKEAKAIVKDIRKVTIKAEKDINKIYIRLDKYYNDKHQDLDKEKEVLVNLAARRKMFHQDFYDLWKEFKSIFNEEEWSMMLLEAEKIREEKSASKK